MTTLLPFSTRPTLLSALPFPFCSVGSQPLLPFFFLQCSKRVQFQCVVALAERLGAGDVPRGSAGDVGQRPDRFSFQGQVVEI